jgi:hypothetical protein
MFFCRHLNRVLSTVNVSSATYSHAELDSHADTCAFGDSAFIVQDTLQSASVSPFLRSLGSIADVRIVTAAIAYDCPDTFTTSILHFPQSLYIPDLENPLILPNQLQAHGIVVNDTPLFALLPNQRDDNLHCILSPEHSLRIPLKLDCVISYFQTRKPTIDEICDRDRCVHTEMCSFQNWDPYADHFSDDENSLRSSISTTYNFPNRTINAAITGRRQGTITPQQLADRWRIGIETGKRTVENTTQLAVRDFTHTTGGRRLKPIHYQLKS